ncbi:MAG: urease accessory protein UreF [Gammaproteobacteria bacterium]
MNAAAPATGAHVAGLRDPARLARLLQLCSPSLPVGTYAFSQGLEAAVELCWVTDEAALRDWCGTLLHGSVARVDLPLFARCFQAWALDDAPSVRRLSAGLLARRETAELRREECERGQSLARLLRDLGHARAAPWAGDADASFCALFALAAVEWSVPVDEAALGYAWTWLEGAVIAGVKLIPLGQVAGQRLLLELGAQVTAAVAIGLALDDARIGASAPGLAIASCHHERQHTRLFKS